MVRFRTGFKSIFPIISSFGEKNLSMDSLCFMEINIDRVSDIRYVIVNQYKNRDNDDQIVNSVLHCSYYSCTCNF